MSQQVDHNNEASERRKSNIGIKMTILYSIVYAGFVILSVFYPASMGMDTIFGVNLAIAYGLGLIVIAIIFAMIYNQLVRIPKGPVPLQPEISVPNDQEER